MAVIETALKYLLATGMFRSSEFSILNGLIFADFIV